MFQQVRMKHNQHIKDMRKSFAVREKSIDNEDTEMVLVKKVCLQPNPVRSSIRDKRTSYVFSQPVKEQETQISKIPSQMNSYSFRVQSKDTNTINIITSS